MTDENTGSRMLFDFFIHEAENLHNRVDWFLIFHAILFEAFLGAHYYYHRIVLGLLGCVISQIWLITGIRQVWNINHLCAAVSDRQVMGPQVGELFTKFYEARKLQPSWMKKFSSNPAFSIVFPFVLLLAWLLLTTTAMDFVDYTMLKIALGALVFVSVVWLIVARFGPRYDDKSIKRAVAHMHGTNRSRTELPLAGESRS